MQRKVVSNKLGATWVKEGTRVGKKAEQAMQDNSFL